MKRPVEFSVGKAVDSIQRGLADYAHGLTYDSLPLEVVHIAKVRIIDTLGALIGGFFGEPCQIARELAARMPCAYGATVIGTRTKTMLDMAGFVNGTTARYLEMTDTYHWPGSYDGHPSDVITPLIAAAEHGQTNGRDLITSVVLAYEVYLRICDIFRNHGFDHTNFASLGTAVGASRLLSLSPSQIAHCISMVVVPNNVLKQVRLGHLSMFKAAASGQAGRAGLFAVLLAQAGIEGPHMPFEGKAGWCDHVAGDRFSLSIMGGDSTPFKILDTSIKHRPCSGPNISVVLAAEKVALMLKSVKDVKQVTVELYQKAMEWAGTGAHHWNPDSRETADHSAPYVVAATLMDGTVSSRSYNNAHLWNPELRALMQKIKVVENEEFTKAYNRLPVEHRTRVTVVTNDGEQLVGDAGGDNDDLWEQKSDIKIEEKFRELGEDFLGEKRINSILKYLWELEEMENVSVLPRLFVVD